MAEYIKRDSLLEFLDHKMEANFAISPIFTFGLSDVINNVRQMPAEDVKSVVRGKWIDVPDGHLAINYQCSVCKKNTYTAKQYDISGNEYVFEYCPHCGARMDGEQ